MKTDKRTPKCRTGSREAWKNKLRMLQPPHLLPPPALGELSICHNHQSSQIPQPLGDKNKTEKKTCQRVTCHNFDARKYDEIKSVGILFIFLLVEEPFKVQSLVHGGQRTLLHSGQKSSRFSSIRFSHFNEPMTDVCFCWTPQICKFPKSVLQVVTTNSQNCHERWNPILFLI